ncbi:hypothetical protein [Epibacterium ulvae]|uniref:hypothetical protein n=1 Tax=Epibacterium ulvae TaxID=1156985 RepID=UPI002492AA29|nr:hypothetical protein [Epibacterium ulvae]
MSQTFAPPALLRRLTHDNKTMGPRLAQLEFQNLSQELDQPGLFDLALDFPTIPPEVPQTFMPNIALTPVAAHLPALNVTLGRTAWVEDPDDLPVVGIWIGDLGSTTLRPALKALLRKHYITPFARYVFLCETMRVIPFLGRYDFSYDYIGPASPLEAVKRLQIRYAMVQMRDLASGAALWKAQTPPVAEPVTGQD